MISCPKTEKGREILLNGCPSGSFASLDCAEQSIGRSGFTETELFWRDILTQGDGCYMICVTKEEIRMVIEIDFQSDEAIYMQLRNQIIIGIATSTIREGDPLPSVRQLAGDIGINMHTVNKAYSVLRQEGFVTIDRRRGAVIALDANKIQAVNEIRQNMRVVLAKGICKNISRAEIHEIVDEIYDEYGQVEEL